MTPQQEYDETLESAVTKLKTLESFLESAKYALDNEDIGYIYELADTMTDRADSFYCEINRLKRAYEELQDERESA